VTEIDSATQPFSTELLAARADPNSPNDIDIKEKQPTAVQDAAAPSKTTINPTVVIRPTSLLYRPVILPFHFTITESCFNLKKHVPGPEYHVLGTYTNGLVTSMNLSPSTTASVNHTITEYPELEVGPYVGGRLRFGYKSPERKIECVWWSSESWRRCGECREEGWSACGAEGESVMEMECSFIMGYGNLGS
jgi:hypothetical protein